MSFKFINGIQPKPIKKDFDSAMNTLLENINKDYEKWRGGYEKLNEKLSLKPGRKFIKVIRGGSVWDLSLKRMVLIKGYR